MFPLLRQEGGKAQTCFTGNPYQVLAVNMSSPPQQLGILA